MEKKVKIEKSSSKPKLLKYISNAVEINGVKIVGQSNLPGEVANNASQMYSNNLTNLLQEFWNEESGVLELDPEDDIVMSCVITRSGSVVNEALQSIYKGN